LHPLYDSFEFGDRDLEGDWLGSRFGRLGRWEFAGHWPGTDDGRDDRRHGHRPAFRKKGCYCDRESTAGRGSRAGRARPGPAFRVSLAPFRPGARLARRARPVWLGSVLRLVWRIRMSDLGRRESLSPSRAQLPVAAYFDDALLAREIATLFRAGPGYVGHELLVPEPGDYQTLAAEHDGRVLVRNDRGVELLANVCRHRQAIMLNGRGNTGNIVCPLHRWTYNLRGELLGAPQFPEQPCASLARNALQNWRGLLFDGPRDIAADLRAVGLEDTIDFDGYLLGHVEVHECHYNWKTFLGVYLEDDHAGPFHPGLGKFVSCDDLAWTFGDWFSVQT